MVSIYTICTFCTGCPKATTALIWSIISQMNPLCYIMVFSLSNIERIFYGSLLNLPTKCLHRPNGCFLSVLWSIFLGHPVHFIQVLWWWAGTEARRGTILPSRHLDIECWILLQTSTRHKMDAAIVATVHSYCDNATKICGAHLTFYLSSKYVSQYHLYMPAKYCYKMMKIFEWYLVIDIDKFLLSHTRHKTCYLHRTIVAPGILPSAPVISTPVRAWN